MDIAALISTLYYYWRLDCPAKGIQPSVDDILTLLDMDPTLPRLLGTDPREFQLNIAGTVLRWHWITCSMRIEVLKGSTPEEFADQMIQYGERSILTTNPEKMKDDVYAFVEFVRDQARRCELRRNDVVKQMNKIVTDKLLNITDGIHSYDERLHWLYYRLYRELAPWKLP